MTPMALRFGSTRAHIGGLLAAALTLDFAGCSPFAATSDVVDGGDGGNGGAPDGTAPEAGTLDADADADADACLLCDGVCVTTCSGCGFKGVACGWACVDVCTYCTDGPECPPGDNVCERGVCVPCDERNNHLGLTCSDGDLCDSTLCD